MSAKTSFLDGLQSVTERFLSDRKRKKRIKREKQKAKNPIVDWGEAFLWAAGVVLLVNQYLFQAYQIPSGSMMHTLLIGDRIFVNKLVYGPELLPGLLKLPSPFVPEREEVIIFENPSYLSNGAGFDIAQRVIYMLTLSLVDIDRDEAGQPRPHFLIKRAVSMGGDQLSMHNGNMSIRFAGEDRWVEEQDYLQKTHATHVLNRLVSDDEYPAIRAAARVSASMELGTEVPLSLQETLFSSVFLHARTYLPIVERAASSQASALDGISDEEVQERLIKALLASSFYGADKAGTETEQAWEAILVTSAKSCSSLGSQGEELFRGKWSVVWASALSDLNTANPETFKQKWPSFVSFCTRLLGTRDQIAFEQELLGILRSAVPNDESLSEKVARRYELGWYVPETRIFPMGDNRDNSHDARYFGAVHKDKVLGKAMAIYWPFKRWTVIR